MQLLRQGGTKKDREHRWYRLAFVLAVIVFILLAPEVNNGNYMEPTISDGQVLITSKTTFTTNRGMPDRGQLVILKKPFSQEAGADDNIITRVIAIPGDTVEITDGKVLVNDEEYVTPNGIKGCRDDFEKVKVKENRVFVLCDNRNTKLKMDSRNDAIGLMSSKEIKGKVLMRVWPPAKLR
ncbi:MAG: signal peptidase I [Bacillota bacterium]